MGLTLTHFRDLFTDIFSDTFGVVAPGLAANTLTLTLPSQSLEITMAGWHAGDTDPALTGVASTDGVAVDLTGATCVVHVERPDGTFISRAPTVAVGTTGAWSLPWQTTELIEGVYSVELEVTWSTGHVQTFGPVSFRVDPQLA